MRSYKSAGISRRKFIKTSMAGAILAGTTRIALPKNRPPNVLFILADDLGYGDLSCFGRQDYDTPNLDRLAQQGIRFTAAYSASPVCTPTRCAFVTGRYPARTPVGLQEPLRWKRDLGDKVTTLGLSPDHPTVASLLKGKGYETVLIGKWHLGYLPKFGPNHHGFDKFFGILSGAADFFTHKDGNGDPDLYEDEVPIERIGYMTDLLTQRAIEFISGPHNRPFYLSLHYTAPHWPWEGPDDKHVAATLKKGLEGFTAGGSLKTYAAMVKSLDDGIGQVLKALVQAKLDRETLVIFTSDNGGERFSFNWPFAGQKGSVFEGGIRVPAIVRWPGVVPAGRSTEQVAVTMDWTATILAGTGTAPHPRYPLDGKNLLPVIKGESLPYERKLFWRFRSQDALRSGRWKYVNDGQNQFLFDLSIDQRERANFKEKHPEVFNQLRSEFQAWEARVLPRPEAAG
jgi:arylsulfatase A-like enzyme